MVTCIYGRRRGWATILLASLMIPAGCSKSSTSTGDTASQVRLQVVDNPEYSVWAKLGVGTSITQKSVFVMNGMKLNEFVATSTLVKLDQDAATIERVTIKTERDKVESKTETFKERSRIELPAGKKADDLRRPNGTYEEGHEELTVLGVRRKAKWYKVRYMGDHGTVVSQQVWIADNLPGSVRSVVKMEDPRGKVPPLDSISELVEVKRPKS